MIGIGSSGALLSFIGSVTSVRKLCNRYALDGVTGNDDHYTALLAEQAAAYYRQVAQEFPDSSFAAQAKVKAGTKP